MPAPTTIARKPSGTACGAGGGSPRPSSAAIIGPYSGGTASPIATLSIRTSWSCDGAGQPHRRPAAIAAAAAARISACTCGGRPPSWLSSSPFCRAGA